MTIKRYKVEQDWGDAEVTLDVDHDKLTPELATLINTFWTGADERLDSTDGDVVLAVIKMAAAEYLGWVLDVNSSYSNEGMEREFDDLEGWPARDERGIRLVDWDGRPDLDPDGLKVTELEVGGG
ncbi:MAG: DUF2528 family protein [Stenotrophomonas sp.]|uniref:DUF2528 family protein n=1 Tax=Stenotrophomonas sp. TaxID=69392 RepID=UPI003D6D7EE5